MTENRLRQLENVHRSLNEKTLKLITFHNLDNNIISIRDKSADMKNATNVPFSIHKLSNRIITAWEIK